MKYARDIQGLRRYIFASQILVGLVLSFASVSFLLFFDPSMVGAPVDQAFSYQGDPFWLVTGIGLLVLGAFFLFVPLRWARRLLWIWKNIPPEPMELCLEVDQQTDPINYYALLSAGQDGSDLGYRWKTILYHPSWNVSTFRGRQIPVKVYFDPLLKSPGVIETGQGMLWSLPVRKPIERRFSHEPFG
jgi:hypothetical protein